MITASRVTRWGGNSRKAGTACASAIADGWGRHSGTDMATDQDSPAPVPGGRLEARVVGSDETLSMVIGELVRDLPAFIPPEPICWDSSDYQLVELDFLWVFQNFIIYRRTHTPSVAPLGQPWVEYRVIAFTDTEGIDEFRRHAGLIGTDPEE